MGITIEGRYVLVESENFDEYLKSCGVNFIVRAIAKKFKPVLDIFRDDEYWVWKSETPLKTIVVRFRLDEEFETDFPDGSGRKILVTATQEENNKIVMNQQLEGRTILDVKEFTEDGMITTIRQGNVVAVRKYNRVS